MNIKEDTQSAVLLEFPRLTTLATGFYHREEHTKETSTGSPLVQTKTRNKKGEHKPNVTITATTNSSEDASIRNEGGRLLCSLRTLCCSSSENGVIASFHGKDTTFTGQQAAEAQTALRKALGLPHKEHTPARHC